MLMVSLRYLASLHAVAGFTTFASVCFCWCPYCVGGPVVASISAVACVLAIADILAVACC